MTAAEPQLASDLYARIQYVNNDNGNPPRKRRKLATGCQPVDKMLDGGFDYGSESSLCCISADDTSVADKLSLSILAAHLSLSPPPEATIIDTTLGFDIRGLYNSLHARLLHDEPESDSEALERQTLASLDRVHIMKVFDFVGLTESLDELRTRLRQYPDQDLRASPSPKPPKGTVQDSQDDEEEMLDTAVPAPPVSTSPSKSRASTMRNTDPASSNSRVPSLLLITNIAHVTSPLLKQNHTQGQALLSSFMRSLSHLTREQDLCTLLLNTTIPHNSARDGEAPSIFSSCNLQPALGRSFGYLVDMHLLLHEVPRTAEGGGSGGKERQRGGGGREMVNVLEVLRDRHGSRMGRWAAFTTGTAGQLKPAF